MTIKQTGNSRSGTALPEETPAEPLALQALGSVTTYEASRYLDLYDPRARKKELLREGHAIDTIPARVVTESGEVHRIGRYVLMTHAIQREAA